MKCSFGFHPILPELVAPDPVLPDLEEKSGQDQNLARAPAPTGIDMGESVSISWSKEIS